MESLERDILSATSSMLTETYMSSIVYRQRLVQGDRVSEVACKEECSNERKE